MSTITVEMTARELGLWRAQQKIIDQQVRMEGGYRKVGTRAGEAGRKSQQASNLVTAGLTKILGLLAGGASVTAAVYKVNQAYDVWLTNQREISAEVQKASSEMVALAALQEGGTKRQRVLEATALAQRYGITERGVAYDTVQAMQSMLGSWEEGVKAAGTIFAAQQVGIPLELGRELEVQGISQGAAPGEMLRYAYVAGQASGRTPEDLADVIKGLKFFTDKSVGMAYAGAISGKFQEDLGTYVKRGGEELTDVSSIMDWFKERGAGPGTSQFQRLRTLYNVLVTEEGRKTDAEINVALKELGVSEKRARESLADAISLFGEVERIRGLIQKRAKPGLLIKERIGMEKELPEFKRTREIEQLQAAFAAEQAFGAGAPRAQEAEKEQYIRGLALKRMGYEQALWIDLIGPEGKSTPRAAWLAELASWGGRRGDFEFGEELEFEMEKARRELAAASPEVGAGQRAAPEPLGEYRRRSGFGPEPAAWKRAAEEQAPYAGQADPTKRGLLLSAPPKRSGFGPEPAAWKRAAEEQAPYAGQADPTMRSLLLSAPAGGPPAVEPAPAVTGPLARDQTEPPRIVGPGPEPAGRPVSQPVQVETRVEGGREMKQAAESFEDTAQQLQATARRIEESFDRLDELGDKGIPILGGAPGEDR